MHTCMVSARISAVAFVDSTHCTRVTPMVGCLRVQQMSLCSLFMASQLNTCRGTATLKLSRPTGHNVSALPRVN